MKLLDLILEEQKRLKSIGWKPKFRGDTGINIAKLMINNDVELRNSFDESFIDGYKETLSDDQWCHYSGMPSPNSYK